MGKKAAVEAVHGIKAFVPMIRARGTWWHIVNVTARCMHSRCTKSRMVESVRSNFNGMRPELEGHKSKSWYGSGDAADEIPYSSPTSRRIDFSRPKPVKRSRAYVKQCSLVTFSKKWYGRATRIIATGRSKGSASRAGLAPLPRACSLSPAFAGGDCPSAKELKKEAETIRRPPK
jgi:hypothetical protein